MGVNSRDMMGCYLVGERELDVKESAGMKEGKVLGEDADS